MKWWPLVLLVLIFLAGLFLFTMRHTEPISTVSCSERVPRIVAFGDSLVEGYGADTTGGFVTLLSKRVSVPIENQGVSGNTTSDALTRVASVAQEKPDIVLILLGGNDALQRVTLSQTTENLSRIIKAFQASPSTRVVLIGVLGGFPSDPFSGMFQTLAHTFGVTYVPNILSGIITDRSLMSDQVHPNEAGYTKIADTLTPILEAECAKLPESSS